MRKVRCAHRCAHIHIWAPRWRPAPLSVSGLSSRGCNPIPNPWCASMHHILKAFPHYLQYNTSSYSFILRIFVVISALINANFFFFWLIMRKTCTQERSIIDLDASTHASQSSTMYIGCLEQTRVGWYFVSQYIRFIAAFLSRQVFLAFR